MRKCQQLSEDLAKVYSLLQNSKNSCFEKGKTIAALEAEIKQLRVEKGQLEDETYKVGALSLL